MDKRRVIRVYLVAVALVLAYIAYMSFTKPLPTRKPGVQSILNTQIPFAVPGPPPTASAVAEGNALAIMRIPRFGEDWIWTALEGTDITVVNNGPGHYSNTELPGEEGNVAFAAHRATHGDPFIDFDELQVGDEVILSQRGATWTYTLTTRPEIIEASARWVLDDFAPGKWLTLTTCWPKYGSEKRMFVRAELTDVDSSGAS